ncbi:MAG TPA: hypothetical protein VHO28_09890 [Ignavibacteriales bacterium]|nr:hypothetical protein [Ignavibacteriales bacterium]
MPLRKPSSEPNVPKTRAKKPSGAQDEIAVKKKDKIEYICKAFFRYDEPNKKQLYGLSLETVVQFTSFAYEISVSFAKERNVINISLLGLKTKANMIPQAAPAKTEIFLEELFGEHTVNVIKQDGSINTGVFDFNIYKKEIKLVNKFVPEKKNNRLFCDFQVSETDYTFPAELK